MRRNADDRPANYPAPKLAGGFTARHRRRATALAIAGASALVLAMAPAGGALAGATPGKSTGVGAGALRLTAAQARSLSANVTTPVIVFLKDQPSLSPASARSAERTDAIAASQAPFLGELAEVHATRIKTYSLVNALAATVSAGEEKILAADPAVAQVIPDGTIEEPSPAVPAKAAGPVATHATSPVLPGACLPKGGVELDPEGLSLTSTDSQTAGAQTARSLGFTGAGVTVGFMADGIDPDNANFIRSDGKSVFTHYVDFSSDGIDAATDGTEAFLDASAIAGQGTTVYNTQGFGADSPATACNIRIEGFAPGASLVGLKVFAQNHFTTTSAYLQAIDYAVETAKVNVLNQSFDFLNYPDTTLDAIREFDNAAVAAGVTVTVSSGDAGPGNNIGSPATDPDVISVGATTDFRFYAQTGYAGADEFATKGWLNDNISAFSSSGYSQVGGTVDMVAPGDLSFASCDDNVAEYAGCTNLLGKGSDLELGGGTSQAAPEVAGAAALVIQAYRSAHDGATPSPALIKQILLSTASDLGAPAEDQGAGLLDSYKAVEMAMSINKGKAAGETVATSANQLSYVGAAGVEKTWKVAVTNTGAGTQTIHLTGRAYGASKVVSTGGVTLSDSKSPHFTDASGDKNNYGELHFTVPKGADQLNAAIAYQSDGATYAAQLSLIDPQGRFAANSEPPTASNYGSVDVLHPAAGTWTAVIFSETSANSGTVGKVQFGASVSDYAGFGAVSPSTITLAPGASSVVSVTATTPSAAGDASGAVVLNSGHGATTIPVVLRGLVNVARGGAFSGVVTGGNGRPLPDDGQIAYYEFSVPAGRADIAANMTLANDPAVTVIGFLVAPDGETVGFGSNTITTVQTSSTLVTVNVRGLSLYAVRPAAGMWTLIIDFTTPVAGNELTDRYTGTIRFATIPVSAKGLPDSAAKKLPAGKAVTVPVEIKNTGASAEAFFVDPRLTSTGTYPLLGATPVSLPLGEFAPLNWFVPTQTTTLRVTAKASLPVTFTYAPAPGDPDLDATSSGDDAAGTFSAGQITPGMWYGYPSEIPAPDGYPAKGGKAGTVTMTVTAVMQKFDTTITSGPGDFWLTNVSQSATWAPFVVNPGQTRTIDVTIRPSGKAGTVVRGDLYVDEYTSAGTQVWSGSEVTEIPYAYKIG
jgi:Subtilase family